MNQDYQSEIFRCYQDQDGILNNPIQNQFFPRPMTPQQIMFQNLQQQQQPLKIFRQNFPVQNPQNQMIGSYFNPLNEPARMYPFQNQLKKVDQTNIEKSQVVVIDDDEPQIISNPTRKREFQQPIPQIIPIQQPYNPFYSYQQPVYQPMMLYQPPMSQPPPFQQMMYPQFQGVKTIEEPKLNNISKQDLKQADYIKKDDKVINLKNKQPRNILDIDVLEKQNLIYDPEIKQKSNNRQQTRRRRKSSNDDKNNSSSYQYEEFTQRKRPKGRKNWNQKAKNDEIRLKEANPSSENLEGNYVKNLIIKKSVKINLINI